MTFIKDPEELPGLAHFLEHMLFLGDNFLKFESSNTKNHQIKLHLLIVFRYLLISKSK